MKYRILKQFLPGNDSIWVQSVDESDPVQEFGTIDEAETKKQELESNDSSRAFKIVEIPD